jgi:DNA-binding MarR family transcriptional regulator
MPLMPLMPHSRKPPVPMAERTPEAQLAEGLVHGIVGYQLAQAAVVTDRVFDEQAGAEGLRRVEFTILALLQANPDLHARQLARALAVTPSNIKAWIDRLEQRGWVTRTPSTADARMQHLRLTRAGLVVLQHTSDQVRVAERAALGGLSEAERAMLLELLHKVALARRPAGGAT